ncbi:MAG: hypothetical protein HOM11_01555 [Methylococcales bacterium]|jgi:hypothetical protein|nr:hypothetical protein [Methylococcales bacterium]MBT7442523.1 hypothetical protein [Methylococcales bacterium]
MAAKMNRQQALDELAHEHHIEGPDIYLLELIPLIEMIWADGVAQEAEMDVMREYMIAHVGRLNEAAAMEVVTNDDVQRFFQRFCHERPAPELLKTIRELSVAVFLNSPDESRNREKRDTLLAYCLDIAAATVLEYPYGRRERIVAEEKAMLLEIMEHFQISLDREW